ncbi:MAG: ABC transporter permease [Oligoflexales bacterium]|nr:ABC transporter permease [Oligoflexales bacterium]
MALPRSAMHVCRVNFNSRAITFDLIARDLKLRYLGSMIGRYWNLIHPLAMIAIYTIIFSKVMEAKIGVKAASSPFGFTIYLCAGLIPWMSFTETVTRGANVFLENAHLIKKISFPTEILYSIVAGASTVTFTISMAIYLTLILVAGHGVEPPFVLVPVIFIMQMMFAIGLAMFLSVFTVFFRDTQQILSIVFQIWFWVTPIVYLSERAPRELRWIFRVNPYYYFVEIYHDVIVEQVWPSLELFSYCALFAFASFIVGSSFLMRFKEEIPDEI